MSVNLVQLHEQSLEDLRRQASELGVAGGERLRRGELAFQIAKVLGDRDQTLYGRGVLEVHGEGFGFLRAPEDNFLPGPGDIYVSQSQIRRFKLETGDTIIGVVRPPKEGERYPALLRVETINGDPTHVEPVRFDQHPVIYPDEHIPLDGDPAVRAIDLVAPLGLGQRGLLVAPEGTGRNDLLRRLLDTVASDEDLEVSTLLLGERPEEIQVWRKHASCEVVATPFDEVAARHVQLADIVIERGRRMAERGDDVILVINGVDRLLRALSTEQPAGGTQCYGVPAAALEKLRKYIGAARTLDECGSFTILAVVVDEPGNVYSDAAVAELRGLVNWKLFLSRELSHRGLVPAIDLASSGTLGEEHFLDADELGRRVAVRRTLPGGEEGLAALLAWAERPTLDSIAGSGQ